MSVNVEADPVFPQLFVTVFHPIITVQYHLVAKEIGKTQEGISFSNKLLARR